MQAKNVDRESCALDVEFHRIIKLVCHQLIQRWGIVDGAPKFWESCLCVFLSIGEKLNIFKYEANNHILHFEMCNNADHI